MFLQGSSTFAAARIAKEHSIWTDVVTGGINGAYASVLLQDGSIFYSIGNFSGFSYAIKKLRRGIRTAVYKADAAVRPTQARVSQAKLLVLQAPKPPPHFRQK